MANSIVLGDGSGTANPLGPFGVAEPLWSAGYGPALTGGGFTNTIDTYGLDPTRTYRFSAWVRFHGSLLENFFLAGDKVNNTLYNLSPGAADTNPVFCTGQYGACNLIVDHWYLAVGVIHGSGYAGGQSGLSGLYDPYQNSQVPLVNGISNGVNVVEGADFKFAPGTTQTTLRCVGSNATATGTTFWARPRFEEMNGQEPSILNMLSAAGLVFNNGTYMKVLGVGFGANSNYLMWYGPSQSSANNWAACTDALALAYMKTDGTSYTAASASAKVTRTYIGTSVDTTGTETIPTGYTTLVVEIWGGDGSGAAGYGTGCAAGMSGGGASGSYSRTSISVVGKGGQTIAYVAGKYGAGGPGNGNPGNQSTIIAGTFTITTMTAPAGNGGQTGSSGAGGTAGAAATGGTAANVAGNAGHAGDAISDGYGGAGIAGVNDNGATGGNSGFGSAQNGRHGGGGKEVFTYT